MRHAVLLILLSAALTPLGAAQDAPPRFEVGAVINGATAHYDKSISLGQGGGRLTVNVKPFLGVEMESARYRSGNFFFGPAGPEEEEVHTSFAAKATYRVEGKRWLRFAGINAFGLAGPGFLNHTIEVDDPTPVSGQLFPATVLRRHTVRTFDFGGGVEVVPARFMTIRLDITEVRFHETTAYHAHSNDDRRTFVKLAWMFRFR